MAARVLLPTFCFLMSAPHALPDSPPDANAMVERAEGRLRAAKTLSFRVIQRYILDGLPARTEEAEVSYARPGKIRWAYAPPEANLFVSDGKRVYFHLPLQNTVHAAGAKEAERANPLLGFLLQSRPLRAAYDFSVAERTPDGEWLLNAAPKSRAEARAAPFLLYLSAEGEFRRVAWLDGADGLTEMYLSDIRYDPPLDAALFRFEIPAGAEVVEGLGFDAL
jgi:outer membrane lipoprotein carrier protein